MTGPDSACAIIADIKPNQPLPGMNPAQSAINFDIAKRSQSANFG
jgi:hypothetical protein